jgi:ATP-dependent Clp protease ATP-binding subunit ClpA
MQNSGSFDRFTERARKVLTLAQEEAHRFNHNYIGPEHLLLGLTSEGEGVAAKVLSNLGIELTKVRSAVEFIIGRGERQVIGEIGLTPRAKKVIELAVDEARRLDHHYVGTEHLLLGLIREGEGMAAGVLESLGVNLEKVRSEVIKVLTQTGSSEHAMGGAAPARTPTTFTSWEHLVVRIIHQENGVRVESVEGPEPDELDEHHPSTGSMLRVLGSAGWELAGIDPLLQAEASDALYVFKRPNYLSM